MEWAMANMLVMKASFDRLDNPRRPSEPTQEFRNLLDAKIAAESRLMGLCVRVMSRRNRPTAHNHLTNPRPAEDRPSVENKGEQNHAR